MNAGNIPSKRSTGPSKSDRRRFGRAQEDHIIDSYRQMAKPHDPAFCPQCGATYDRGRWHWSPRVEGAQPSLCPACHRINDHYPAGILTLKGKPVETHKDEIIRLARHQEEAEKKEHPLNRIMAIEEKAPDSLEISTTDIHLPRRIGDVMRRTYQGEMTENFDEGAYFVRVNWHRDT